MLKNSELFPKCEELETQFFGKNLGLLNTGDEPWVTLVKVLEYLSQFVGDQKIPWPKNAPSVCTPGADSSNDGGRGRNEAQGVIESFGSEHVRGGKGLKTDENTKIRGPVILGSGVTLRKGAVITGPCLIGDGAVIGVGCRIKHSILLPGAHVVFGTRISYSILGRNARIGSGAVSEEESFETGEHPWTQRLPEIGFFAGDRSWVGGGAIISPAVNLARGVRVQEGALLPFGDYRKNVRAGLPFPNPSND